MEMQSNLRNHIEKKHKSEEEVKHALQLRKQERNKAFNNMKKRGIMLKIIDLKSKQREKNLLNERSRGNKDTLIYCSKCLAHISRQYFCRHKTLCCMVEHSTYIPLPITTRLHCDGEENITLDETFLKSFRKDEIGNICITDDLILDYGLHMVRKMKNKNYKKNYKN